MRLPWPQTRFLAEAVSRLDKETGFLDKYLGIDAKFVVETRFL
jgi:hypothetical protein